MDDVLAPFRSVLAQACVLSRPAAWAVVALLTHSSPGAQSCGSPALGQVLDAGVVAPPLWTESGPPVVGRSFSLRVSNGAPDGRGILAWSPFHLPRTLPFANGLFHPGAQLMTAPIQLDARGNSPALLVSPPLPLVFCGVELFVQAGMIGVPPGSGITLTNALRLRCGAPSPGPFQDPMIALPNAEFAAFDMDGDGHTDLVVRQLYPVPPLFTEYQKYHVLRNLGNGTFAPGPETLTILEVADFLVDDFDGDGFGDVVTGGTLLTGDATPELTVRGPTFAASFHEPRARGDLDGDGRLDLVGAAFPGLSTALNQGAATFVPGPTTALSVGKVALGRFDADTILDAAVADLTSPLVSILLGNGDGSFSSGPSFATPAPVLALQAHDFDADGLDDLALGFNPDPTLDVRRCLGGGAFDLPLSHPMPEVVRNIEVADLDGDGSADLLANHASLLSGRGDGTFDTVLDYGVQSLQAVLADIDGDGWLDVLGNDGTFLRGLPGGLLRAPRRPMTRLSASEDVAAGDLDADGLDDLLVPDRDADALRYVHTLEGGFFEPEQTVAVGSGPNRVVLGDLDADGDLDALVGHAGQNALVILRGDGSGGLQLAGSHPTGGPASELALTDLNADGHFDLVASHLGLGTGFSTALGNGDGTFQPSATRAVSGESVAVVVGNFRGSADTDVLILRAQNSNHGVLSFPGNGDGTFGTPVTTPTTHAMAFVVPRHMSAADGDLDGDLDLFISAFDGVTEYQLLWRRNANGSFAVQSRLVSRIEQNAVADFSGDGLPDLVATRRGFSLQSLRYFEGDGNLGFPDLGLSQGLGFDSGPLTLGQFDRNGTMDVALVNAGSLDLRVSLNNLGE